MSKSAAGRKKKPVQKSNARRRKLTKRQQRRRSLAIRLLCVFCFLFLLLAGALFFRSHRAKEEDNENVQGENTSDEWEGAPEIDVELLTVNPYSRPQIPLEEINGIVIHYTANPGATAMDNRNYFENLKDTQDNKVSSHFVIGLEGEIVQCIPSTEIAYASNSRNYDTLSIECCHPDETGQFETATYDSLVALTGWLCKRFDIPVDNVIRHYDVTGKECPKYYVDYPEAWSQLKADIQERIEQLKSE